MQTPPSALPPRGLRITDAAKYSGFTSWFVEEAIRAKQLRAVKPSGCGHYVIYREDLDSWMDDLRDKTD